MLAVLQIGGSARSASNQTRRRSALRRSIVMSVKIELTIDELERMLHEHAADHGRAQRAFEFTSISTAVAERAHDSRIGLTYSY